MNRKRTSIIWKLSDENFADLIRSSISMSQVLRYFGMENKGGNYKTCRQRIAELRLDTSHFLNRIESSVFYKSLSKEDVLIKLESNSEVNRQHLKKLLIKFGLVEYVCHKCGNNGEWNGEKLSLQLEHNNGISNDNRIENLSFLCPNCHSQTATFAGKRHRKYFFCKTCEKPCKGYSPNLECASCSLLKIRNLAIPLPEELLQLILKYPITSIGQKFGVCDQTVRKWCKKYHINHTELSPFSRLNKVKKPKPAVKQYSSKYLFVSFVQSRQKWTAIIKNGRQHICQRYFDTELESAEFVADFFKSKDLIIRRKGISKHFFT